MGAAAVSGRVATVPNTCSAANWPWSRPSTCTQGAFPVSAITARTWGASLRADPADWSADNLHLNARGYANFAAEIIRAIEEQAGVKIT